MSVYVSCILYIQHIGTDNASMCATGVCHNLYLDIERSTLGMVWSKNFYFQKFNKSDVSGSLAPL